MLILKLKQRSEQVGEKQVSDQANRQTGMTLIELLISMVVSLIASLAMITLMANTLSTGTHTIQMTRLTQEMRTAMQLISRDLRRANFHLSAATCYGNVGCNPDDTKIKPVTPVDGDCFQFWYDRADDANLDAGAFQLYTRGGVNVLQMTTVDDPDPVIFACNADWGVAQDITDPDIITVDLFEVSNADSYDEVISEDGGYQRVSKIRLTMTASLLNSPVGIPVTKTIEDLIMVRNHIFCDVAFVNGICP